MIETASAPHRAIARSDRGAPGQARALATLVAFELRRWWRTPAGWVQAAVYTLAVAGFGALVLLDAPEAAGQALELRMAPFAMHLLFAGAGAILTAQGAIVGERQDGTAAWVLAKPVARGTWLAAKAASLLGGFVVASVVVPLAALQGVWTYAGMGLSAPQFATAAFAMTSTVAFLLAATLALGTLFRTRGAVAGIGLGLLFVLIQLGQQLPAWMPSGLAFQLGAVVHTGEPLAATTVVLTLGATGAALGVAAWRLGRLDL
ncbi:MAG: ABC transporter permease subunit [Deinococcus-Thermus bacterium]|jgi:ABC-2 type transport system permease protein|nr:ABC transporter permease subunit [Deinococcota bacterium]